MASRRRRFSRESGVRPYRKLFLIAVEGSRTEPAYFDLFRLRNATVRIKCLPGRGGNAPPQILKRIEGFMGTEDLRSSDEAWIVVDRDQWTEEQLDDLQAWAVSVDNRGFCLSNPCFEFWLLLHFEEGAGITSSRDCVARLRRHLPDYDKVVDARKFLPDQIDEAIRRARMRDIPPSSDWPRIPGNTTVYRLVEKLQDRHLTPGTGLPD